MRRALRQAFQRFADRAGNLAVADLARSTRPGIIVKALQAALRQSDCASCSPSPHTRGLGGNLFIGEAICGCKHDARPHRQRLRRTMLAGQSRQHLLLSLLQHNRSRSSFRHSPPLINRWRECSGFADQDTRSVAHGLTRPLRKKWLPAIYSAGGWRRRIPRQSGQVRKEAALTNPMRVAVQPLTASWSTTAAFPTLDANRGR